MRRLLLATFATTALVAAASPAFAFNFALFGQVGSGNTSNFSQTDTGGQDPYSYPLGLGSPVLDNGNSMIGGNILPTDSDNQNDYYQNSAPWSTNTGYAGQAGTRNKAVLHQTTAAGNPGSYSCTGLPWQGTCYGVISVTPGTDNYNNDSSTTQIGGYNSVGTTQNTTSSTGGKGNNKSTVNQLGFFNGSTINQKGGSTQTTSQTGILQEADTTQDGTGNNSTTTQNGPLLGIGGALQFSRVNQKGNNNTQKTTQTGILQASITSQSGNSNDSTTRQTGAGELAITSQSGGSGNKSTTTQSGGLNFSGIAQNGSGNTANVTQSGGTNWSAVGQVGTNNSYTGTQSTQ